MKAMNFIIETIIFIVLLPVVVVWLIVAGLRRLKDDMSIEHRLRMTNDYLRECKKFNKYENTIN